VSDEEDIIMDYVMQDAVIESKLYEDAYSHERLARRRRWGGRDYYEDYDKGRRYSSLKAKTVFFIVFITSVFTLIINPQLLVITIPVSIIAVLLGCFLAAGRKKKARKPRRRIRGDEEWLIG